MPSYDEFREMFANASEQEKLAIIRSESKQLLIMAQGYSQIIQKVLSERKPVELPDDFENWCKKVADNIRETQDLIEALTDREHRSIYREEKEKSDRELSEMVWRDNQQGLPELKSYTSLEDAVDKTAKLLGLSTLVLETKNIDFPSHQGMVHFKSSDRRARIAPQASQLPGHRYLGYVVALEWLSDWRNIKWEEHEGLTSSLEEAVKVLYQWLIKKAELQSIRQEYQWMSSGIVDRKA